MCRCVTAVQGRRCIIVKHSKAVITFGLVIWTARHQWLPDFRVQSLSLHSTYMNPVTYHFTCQRCLRRLQGSDSVTGYHVSLTHWRSLVRVWVRSYLLHFWLSSCIVFFSSCCFLDKKLHEGEKIREIQYITSKGILRSSY